MISPVSVVDSCFVKMIVSTLSIFIIVHLSPPLAQELGDNGIKVVCRLLLLFYGDSSIDVGLFSHSINPRRVDVYVPRHTNYEDRAGGSLLAS